MAEQILSLNKLAFRIGVSRDVLVEVSNLKSSHYDPFIITTTKSDGSVKKRRIDNPDKAIRKIQQRINKKILVASCKRLPSYTTGSIPERSIYKNAEPHTNKNAILLADISNCFPSIRSSSVYSLFRSEFGCSPSVSKVLTKLTTYGDRLPQGAPTSPSLCNLIMAPLVAQLSELASKNDLTFTQYIDDLTFSGNYKTLRSVESEVITLVQKAGFKINRNKLRLVKNNERMEVTGLVVNQGVGVGRSYIRKVQREIMKLKAESPNITGKISFIKSINKSQAKKLKHRLKRKIENNR